MDTADERLEAIVMFYEQCDERGKSDIFSFAKSAVMISEKFKKKVDEDHMRNAEKSESD